MGTKKNEGYNKEALSSLVETMKLAARPRNSKEQTFNLNVDLGMLEKAIKSLSKKDRENIERFWGLTGGPNHSKKLGHQNSKDVAFAAMSEQACLSLRELFKLDYISMYDESAVCKINQINKKVNKYGITDIANLENVKYLMAFFIFMQNGPKMSFETELMEVDLQVDEKYYFDEFVALNEMCEELQEFPNNSIHMKLFIEWLNGMDIKDIVAIQKSLGIKYSKFFSPEEVREMKKIGIEISENFKPREIEELQTFRQIRAFKERIFPYGAWDVTSKFIFGNHIDFEDFMKALNWIRKDWARLESFKTHKIKLKTRTGERNLDVYNIGGLEFTDPNEVMFLYLERNLIESIVGC